MNPDTRMVADLRVWRANNPEADPITVGGEELDALLRVTEDWRVLGGLIPGRIPVEWVRVGDVIDGYPPVSRVGHGNMTVTIHNGPHIVRRFEKQQDWLYVTAFIAALTEERDIDQWQVRDVVDDLEGGGYTISEDRADIAHTLWAYGVTPDHDGDCLAGEDHSIYENDCEPCKTLLLAMADRVLSRVNVARGFGSSDSSSGGAS